MKIGVQRGAVVNIPAPADVTGGEVHAGGDGIGVWVQDGKAGELVALAIAGVVRLPKASGETIALLDAVNWDDGNSEIANAGSVAAGIAAGDAADSDTHVDVLLNGTTS